MKFAACGSLSDLHQKMSFNHTEIYMVVRQNSLPFIFKCKKYWCSPGAQGGSAKEEAMHSTEILLGYATFKRS